MTLLNALTQYQEAPSEETEGRLVSVIREILESPNYAPETLASSLTVNQYAALLKLPDSLKCKVVGIDPLDENLKLARYIYRNRIEYYKTTELFLENGLCSPLNDSTLAALLRLFRVYQISRLNLRSNNLGSQCVALLQGLSDIPTVTSIDFGNNSMTTEDAIAISKIVKDNRTITYLNLGNNRIGSDGVIAVANALEHNKTLVNLGLYGIIGVGDPPDKNATAIDAITNMLKNNSTLVTLNLNDSFLYGTPIIALIAALKYNHILTSFKFKNDYIDNPELIYTAVIETLSVNFSILEIDLPINVKRTKSLNELLTRNKKLNMSAIFRLLRLLLAELSGLHFVTPGTVSDEIVRIPQLFTRNKNLITAARNALNAFSDIEKTSIEGSPGYTHFLLLEKFSNSFDLEGTILVDDAVSSLYQLHQLSYLRDGNGLENSEYIQELDHLYHFLFQESMDDTLKSEELHDIYISMLAIASLFPQEYGISYMRGTTDSLLELEAKKPDATITFRGMLTEKGYDQFTTSDSYKTLIAPALAAKCKTMGIPIPGIAKLTLAPVPDTAPVVAQVQPT